MSSNENLGMPLAAWLNSAQIAICVLDDAQRVVLLNPTAGELLGVDAVQVLN